MSRAPLKAKFVRRTLLRLLPGLLLFSGGVATAAPEPVALKAPAHVAGLRLADVNGDGLIDLLLVDDRQVLVYRGRKGRLPAAAPSLVRDIPQGVSFVDVLPAREGGAPALLTLGTKGAGRLPLSQGGVMAPLKGGQALSWRDRKQVTFAPLQSAEGGLLLPHTDGWLYRDETGGPGIVLQTRPSAAVRVPGPFLEDTCSVLRARPRVFVGAPASATAEEKAVGLWTLDGPKLIAQSTKRRVVYDLAFLNGTQSTGIEQRLIDLDGDRRPELIHRLRTDRESRYGFFHTKPVTAEGESSPTHKPAASVLFLSGYQADPDFVDLDGDGFMDLVITSIQVNAANTLRALSSGRVGAETRAFLNRWKDGRGRYFEERADATVKSDISVNLSFNYAGTLEVRRYFTILVDGDMDGDGRKDLAIRTGKDHFTIRRGVGRKGSGQDVWEREGVTLAIPPTGDHPDLEGYTADLDGDGKDEMVLIYRKAPGGKDAVWIVHADLW